MSREKIYTTVKFQNTPISAALHCTALYMFSVKCKILQLKYSRLTETMKYVADVRNEKPFMLFTVHTLIRMLDRA